MIICICRRINEKAVREAVSAGAETPEDVQAHHGCAFNCGKCRPAMGDIINQERAAHPIDPSLLAAE